MALRRVQDNTVDVTNTINNTSVNLIKITEDKLQNILVTHINNLEKPRDVVGAIALLVTLLGAMLTTEFKETWGLSADTWKGVFIVLFIASVVYLVWVIYNYCKNKDGVEAIMKDIKNDQ